MNPSNHVTYLDISEAKAGQRIDNFLHTHLKGVPRSHNRGRIKPTYRLMAGDVLRLPPVQYEPKKLNQHCPNRLKELANTILY